MATVPSGNLHILQHGVSHGPAGRFCCTTLSPVAGALTLSQLLLTQLPVLCPSWDKFCQRGPTWGWWAQLCPVKGLLELSGTALMPALGREPGLTQQMQELCPTQKFLTTLQQDLGPEHFVQLCLLQSFADLWESGSGVADTTKNGK